jgi:hypothetical protein
LPEEHIDGDDTEVVTVHHSLQEASAPTTVPLTWAVQLFLNAAVLYQS